MKGVDRLAMRAALWAIPVLFVILLLLTFFCSRNRDSIYFSIIARALIWTDSFLKPSGISISYGVFNRTLGTVVLWGVAPGSIHCKPVQEGLISDKTN